MANVITAVVTTDFLKFLPKYLGGIETLQIATSFKIGEGGWIDEGSGRVPRTPDASLRMLSGATDDDGNFLQDIDVIVDPTRPAAEQRYPAASLGWVERSFVTTDLVFQAPSTLRCRCFLETTAFTGGETPPGGLPAELYEIGIFTVHPADPTEQLMIAYGTFPQELKDSGQEMENIVMITFAGS